MRLLGRQAERARVDALLEAARAGTSTAMVLVGDPGIGKTELLRYARAHASGMTVLPTRGIESESGLAFVGLADLFKPVVACIDRIPEPQRAALRAGLALEPHESARRYASAAATLSVLGVAAEEQPLLVTVDDAHWLDAASAEALLFAARRLEREGVVLLFASRPDDPRFADCGLEVLTVEGIDDSAAAAIVTERAPTVAPDVLVELVRVAAGNPLALTELPSHLTAEELSGLKPLPMPLPIGASLARAFVSRLERLPDATRRALLVVAASGSTSNEDVFPALERLGLSHALEPAEASELVVIEHGTVEFDHPLVRSAVYGTATPGERRDAHEILAATARGTYGDERRAWHRAAAALAPDEDVAGALESAAGRARRRGGIVAEAELLARAAELTPAVRARSRRRLAAAKAAQLAGRMATAAALAEQALAEADDALLRARIRELQAALAWEVPGLVSVQSLLAGARDVEECEPALAARLLAFGAPMAVSEGHHSTAAAMLDRAEELVTDLGAGVDAFTAVLVGNALVWCGRGSAGYALAARRRDELEEGDIVGKVEQRLHFAVLCHWVEQYDVARDVLERTIDAARAAGAVGFLPLALDTLAAVNARIGRWTESYAASTEALQLADATGQLGHKASFLSTVAALEAAQGREQECRRHAIEALDLAQQQGHQLNAAYARAVLGRLDLGLGRPQEAIRHLVPLEEIARSGPGLLEPGVVPALPDLIEAYVRARRPADARRVLELFSMQSARAQNTWALAATARCRGLLAEEDEFDQHFREAFTWHAQTPRPFERARTELCFGERLRRARRPTEARGVLAAALETFEQLGALPWADRAARELGQRRRHAATTETTPLSAKELQVALMVARGATNREVATALFLSPKTIEAHLSRVYAKLGVRSRTELAAKLMGVRDEDATARGVDALVRT
jgi:DNA-binding CsgD family transcriptional regulator